MTEEVRETLETSHRFLDEMGNPTFFGKGKQCIIGHEGVSLAFGMGIAKIERPLAEVRNEIQALQQQVAHDPLLNTLPSVVKRVSKGGFFFHACKDTPDVRTVFLHYLRELPCSIEVVVARKIPALFVKKHHGQEDEFYADLLAHLIKSRLKKAHRLVLNVAARGSSTRSKVLDEALNKAIGRAGRKWGDDQLQARVVFNVQTPLTEPLLCVPDYLNWAVQRVFERGETRFYDYLKDKIRLVVDLYDQANYNGSRNYYDPKRNPLTAQNKLSPPTT
jgi:hypothetical protein